MSIRWAARHQYRSIHAPAETLTKTLLSASWPLQPVFTAQPADSINFSAFSRVSSFTSGMNRRYVEWMPKTSRQNFFPSRLSQFMPKWSAVLLKAAALLPVCVHFSTWNHINCISSPSRHTLAAWWSPWTPTGPCLSSRQTKWRSIATGTSMSSVHTCESTFWVLSNHPPNLL